MVGNTSLFGSASPDILRSMNEANSAWRIAAVMVFFAFVVAVAVGSAVAAGASLPAAQTELSSPQQALDLAR